MKKVLLTLGLLTCGMVPSFAQTIFYQDFSVTQTNSPAGWTQNDIPAAVKNGGWQFNNTYQTNMKANVPTNGYCAFVDDWDNNPSHLVTYDTLKTTAFNCSAATHVFVSLNFMFWQDDGGETGTIAVSTNGGSTWTTAVNFPNTGGAWEDSAMADISSFAAGHASVMLAFTYFNDYPSPPLNYVAVGMAFNHLDVYAPAPFNVQVTSQTLSSLMQVGKSYTFSGTAYNAGGTAITSMDMNYSVNGGTAQTQALTPSGFNSLTSLSPNWSMNTKPFVPNTAGAYKVKYWANALNGANPNSNTDTLVATFYAFDTLVVRQALMEEFTGQSCVFCMLAGPNCDSVALNNANNSNIIRYHVPIPGRDFMYNETSNGFGEGDRQTYYNVNSAPSGFLDGVSINPSAYQSPPENTIYSSITVQNDNAVGSPFSINITSANYNIARDSFSIAFSVKAFGNFPAGITAQVALTVDSLGYFQDLSQDDPQETFASPIGTGKNIGYGYPDAPDYYYPYVLNFRHVLEAMLPNGNGTSMGAFNDPASPGSPQVQNFSFGWKKNHPWGQYPKGGGPSLGDSTEYDSSSTAHFVVFLQTNSGVSSAGMPAKYVIQSATSGAIVLGMQEIGNSGVYFKMYPNPSNAITNIAFNLDKEQNVSIQVYNLLGENVASINQGTMTTGQHIVPLNCSGLVSGMYIVKLNTDDATTATKLMIQH